MAPVIAPWRVPRSTLFFTSKSTEMFMRTSRNVSLDVADELSAHSLVTCFSDLHVLQSFLLPHVLGAFEGSRIGAAQLAHTALHLLYRFIFVLFHPLPDPELHMTDVRDSIAQQRRAHHRHIRANHEQFDDVFRTVHATGRGEAGPDAPIKNPDPGQGQAKILRAAEKHVGFDF